MLSGAIALAALVVILQFFTHVATGQSKYYTHITSNKHTLFVFNTYYESNHVSCELTWPTFTKFKEFPFSLNSKSHSYVIILWLFQINVKRQLRKRWSMQTIIILLRIIIILGFTCTATATKSKNPDITSQINFILSIR